MTAVLFKNRPGLLGYNQESPVLAFTCNYTVIGRNTQQCREKIYRIVVSDLVIKYSSQCVW